MEHVITGLDTGGAEVMLQKLIGLGGSRFEHNVTSLTDVGPVGRALQEKAVPVRALNMKKDIRGVAAVLRLVREWRRSRPALVQTWMYHGDMVGGLAAALAGVPVVWNIRQSRVGPGVNKMGTSMLVWLCARLSKRLPERIICCSTTAAREHRGMGYCGSRMVVIPNGFDLDAFQPDTEARKLVRRELGVPDNALLVGRIARYHPQKDYGTFVQASARILKRVPDAYFVMAGEGIDPGNGELVRMLRDLEIEARCILLGRRSDVSRVIQALDVTVSSSSCGEGFPNVVGESMACAVPCVVTDVGDSALIVGTRGRVVPPGNPATLADACMELLAMEAAERRTLGGLARDRLRELFNLPDIANQYEALYSEVLADVRDRRIS